MQEFGIHKILYIVHTAKWNPNVQRRINHGQQYIGIYREFSRYFPIYPDIISHRYIFSMVASSRRVSPSSASLHQPHQMHKWPQHTSYPGSPQWWEECLKRNRGNLNCILQLLSFFPTLLLSVIACCSCRPVAASQNIWILPISFSSSKQDTYLLLNESEVCLQVPTNLGK